MFCSEDDKKFLFIYQTLRRQLKDDHNRAPHHRQNLKLAHLYTFLKFVFQSKSNYAHHYVHF
jgi:hypothetical protein